MNTLGFTISFVEWLQSSQNAFLDYFFNVISFLGEQYIFIIILGFIYWSYNKKMGEFLGLTLGFTSVVNNVLKVMINAPRPFTQYPDRVHNLRPSTSSGTSFPSGHTQNFSTLLFSISFFLKKKWLLMISIIFVVLMMFSRMYLGVHYLEDVLVGGLLGFIIAYLSYRIFHKLYENQKSLHRIYLVVLLVSLPIVFVLGSEDLFKGYGILSGFVLAILFEKKFVNFTVDVSIIKKAIRLFLGVFILIGLQIGVKMIYTPFTEEGTYLFEVFDFIRYFLIAFIGFGVYPYFFKKMNL
ncbi:MAG: phosphatase PAP2 family protein [Bacilli bacterium]|nr:phosphatase PAP2 family protein [Bacilli bacterium]